MTKHTPGPWRVEQSSENKSIIWVTSGSSTNPEDITFLLPRGRNRSGVESMANAHLIAAAPELLEALELMQKAVDQLMPGIGNDAPIAAAKAIAKARGIA